MKAIGPFLFGLGAATFLGMVLAVGAAEITEFAVETNDEDQSETAIAVDPLDDQNLMAVWNDFRTVHGDEDWVVPGYGFSSDGGHTWSTEYILHDYRYGLDPSCAFDRYGNAFYCYVASDREHEITPRPVYVSRTTDAGSTWHHFVV